MKIFMVTFWSSQRGQEGWQFVGSGKRAAKLRDAYNKKYANDGADAWVKVYKITPTVGGLVRFLNKHGF